MDKKFANISAANIQRQRLTTSYGTGLKSSCRAFDNYARRKVVMHFVAINVGTALRYCVRKCCTHWMTQLLHVMKTRNCSWCISRHFIYVASSWWHQKLSERRLQTLLVSTIIQTYFTSYVGFCYLLLEIEQRSLSNKQPKILLLPAITGNVAWFIEQLSCRETHCSRIIFWEDASYCMHILQPETVPDPGS